MRRRGTAYALVSLVLVAFLAAGCGGKDSNHATYSVDEVVAAFADHGFVLVKVEDNTPAAGRETILASRNAEKFAVGVTTDAAAADTWKQYVSLGPGPDSLDLKRANVLALSDSGLTSSQKRAVRAAIAALPDRGDEIETLQK